MLGLSYGEIFLILGATAALLGPKDLPRIARVAGRLTGRSIGYIRLARGEFDNVMENSRVHQMHKDMTDQKAQFDAILHEMRSIVSLNPSQFTKRQVDTIGATAVTTGFIISCGILFPFSNFLIYRWPRFLIVYLIFLFFFEVLEKPTLEKTDKQELSMEATSKLVKDRISAMSGSSDMHSQATAYAKLAESTSLKSGSASSADLIELTDESGITVLPLSAESTGMLPNCRDVANGSDIVLEAILEADVARNAKDFFSKSLK